MPKPLACASFVCVTAATRAAMRSLHELVVVVVVVVVVAALSLFPSIMHNIII